MKSSYASALLLLSFFMTSIIAWSQSNEIKITFIGNCGLHLSDGDVNIYADFPYKSGAFNYMEYDAALLDSVEENSLFLFTHRHPDHYSKKLVKRMIKTKNGTKYGPWNIPELEKLNESIPSFSVQAIKSKHRFTFVHYSYVITWHGKRIFLSGDTETADTIGEVKDLDWAFIPLWIQHDAKDRNITIDSKMKAIYHLYPVQIFGKAPPEDIIALVLKEQNSVITIPYDE
jgi:hypothetical protein